MKLKTLGLAAAIALSLVTPLTAEAQPAGKVYRLGFLWGPRFGPRTMPVFEQGLRDLGWIDGQNIVIERRSAEGDLDRLPRLASELVNLKVDLIVALSGPETSAAKQATRTIPIVFILHGDPIGTGAIQSLSRPGGNVTGLMQMHPELAAKQLEILQQVAPRVSRVAVLWNAANAAKANDWRELKPAGQKLGLVLESHEVRRPTDFDGAFAAISKHRPDGMLVLADPLTGNFRESITAFAAKERLPAMYALQAFVAVGGLISYGADVIDLYRRAPAYVDRILKGTKPVDLPVQQPTKFALVINLKTAKALGLTIPPSLLLRADHVIE